MYHLVQYVIWILLSLVMIYLTNTIGLNAGIVGTLIAASKLLEFGEYLNAA